jgi:hypothetical protein
MGDISLRGHGIERRSFAKGGSFNSSMAKKKKVNLNQVV